MNPQVEKIREKWLKRQRRMDGGKGSGNFGHKGRPGEVGGSAGTGASSAPKKGKEKQTAEKKVVIKGTQDLHDRLAREARGEGGHVDVNEILTNPVVMAEKERLKKSVGKIHRIEFAGKEQDIGENETCLIDTPERDRLRREIADKNNNMGAYNGKDENGNPKFDGKVEHGFRAEIVMGPPAGGKSSVIVNKVSKETGSRILDSDEVKKDLPEFDGGNGAGIVHKESADIILEKMIIPEYFAGGSRCGDNIVIPIVGKKEGSVLKYAEKLKEAGYEVHLSFNDVTAENSIKRSFTRFAEEGRFLDPEYVQSIGDKPSKVFEALKGNKSFDTFTKYDNNVKMGEKAKKVERINNKGEAIDWEDWQ